MSDTQARALKGPGDANDDLASATRHVGTAAIGFAALGALALAAWQQSDASGPADTTEGDRAPTEIGKPVDQPTFDGRGKWGGYAR